MRHITRTLVVIGVAFTGSLPIISAAATEWEAVRIEAADASFQAVALQPDSTRVVAATTHAVYVSPDHGTTWQERFRLPSRTRNVDIAVSASQPPTILLATNQGLFSSMDGGGHWSRIFQGSGEGEAECTYVAFHPHEPATAVLSTRGGLFLSRDGGGHWVEIGLPPAMQGVVHFAFDPRDADRVHLITPYAYWVGSLSEGRWQQRLNRLRATEFEPVEPTHELEDTEDSHPESDSPGAFTAIAIDPQQPTRIYLASAHGLQQSVDDGASWDVVTRSGLPSTALSRILLQTHSPTALYAATARGVARYSPQEDRWTALTNGLATSRIHALAASPTHVWAATDQGLYRYQVAPDLLSESEPPSAQDLLANFTYEPTITDVREAAIRYAEVHPSKIARWRTEARLRALVPKLSFTGDTNLTDFRHWDSGTNPDSLIKGERDIDWSANATWELADIIWSDDQTSIDVRSKLMVQLREDIVEQVTRTYFERRRLQIKLLTNPPTDPQVELEHALRLQELTALLDGLTGGYFSGQAMTSHRTVSAGRKED